MIHGASADPIGNLFDLELLQHVATCTSAVFRFLSAITGQLILVVSHVAGPLVMSLHSTRFNHLNLFFALHLFLKRSKWLIVIRCCLDGRLFLTLIIG